MKTQKLKTPQVFFMPAIDPFAILNRKMSEKEDLFGSFETIYRLRH